MTAYSNDIVLITAFQKGEQFAVRKVYDLYFVPLTIFAFRIVGQKEEAEDIVTDSFIKALQKKESFESLQHIKSFLYKVTRNACIDQLDTKLVRQSNHKLIQFLNTEAGETTDAMNEELLRLEVLTAIHAEIETLPEKRKEIFKLLFLEELTTSEIASRLNISIDTVRVQKSLAIKDIRSALLKKNLLTALLYFSLLFAEDKILN